MGIGAASGWSDGAVYGVEVNRGETDIAAVLTLLRRTTPQAVAIFALRPL